MKIARIYLDDALEFAVSHDGKLWYPLCHLGIDVNITREIVEISETIAELDFESTSAIKNPTFLAPIVYPGKVIGIGLNYLDHIRESGKAPLNRPFVFAKFPTSISGPHDDVVVNRLLTQECDWEVELAVVIGRVARNVTREEALEYVFGYLVANDVSARDLQELPGQFSFSKSLDSFCPIGPWITTADEVNNPQQLNLWCTVNGVVRQNSNTQEMLFSVAELIESLSAGMTLEPGDVILSGTPHGVGLGMTPPTYLEHGDRVSCGIEGLGEIVNQIVFQ